MVTRLRELRLARNMSQREMASRLNISQQAYQKYESDKYEPDISTLTQIADVFGVSIDYLVGHQTLPGDPVHPVSDEEYELIMALRALPPYYSNMAKQLIKYTATRE